MYERERMLISGMVKMDISSQDNMRELRAALSDMRLENQPTLEVGPNIPYTEYMLERSIQDLSNNNQVQFLSSLASHALHYQTQYKHQN